MTQMYKTALFIDKSTGKVVYRLSTKPLNNYFWEKRKMEILDWLVKEKFFNKTEIKIKDIEHEQEI
jgi:hypothetical protein